MKFAFYKLSVMIVAMVNNNSFNSLYIMLVFLLINSPLALSQISGTPPSSLKNEKPTSCTENFIFVPGLLPYTNKEFCVSKYEMKRSNSGNAVSKAAGEPWVGITRQKAIKECRSLGSEYDLISNEQWQTIARNITSVPANWSTGQVASGELNKGYYDGFSQSGLPASTDELTGNCYKTGKECSQNSWNTLRRTHMLSNGNIIWDFSGNVSEWISNDNQIDTAGITKQSPEKKEIFEIVAITEPNFRNAYGPKASTVCNFSAAKHEDCGMGNVLVAEVTKNDPFVRGKHGVFAIQIYSLSDSSAFTSDYKPTDVGFRCTSSNLK